MLIERLIFGCGRLTGGATEREALEIVRVCLAAGVRHFDTAPSYGLGSAEIVIGKALRFAEFPVVITVKVGSAPDRAGFLKSYARRMKRRVAPGASRHLSTYLPREHTGRPASGIFDVDAMNRSVARSQERLGRDQLDYILLHEAYPEDLSPDVMLGLQGFLDCGAGKRVGYSNSVLWDEKIDSAFPSHYATQTAIPPIQLTHRLRVNCEKSLFFHSVIRTGEFLRRSDASFAARVELAHGILSGVSVSAQSKNSGVLLALASRCQQNAGLIFSSTDLGHLRELLSVVRAIDEYDLVTSIAETFG